MLRVALAPDVLVHNATSLALEKGQQLPSARNKAQRLLLASSLRPRGLSAGDPVTRRVLQPMVAELKMLPCAAEAETGGLHDVGLAWRENVCDLGAHFTRDAAEWLGSWAETPVSATAAQIWLRHASPVLGFDAVAKAQCAEIAWKLQGPRWTTEDQAMASYASSERPRRA
ncbi:unnamed protein product [Symbiodinium microadriaticum]|nr:unnamed protein product [Symbiodinium microadriaticum]